jgi:hypothetical protein
MRKKGGDKLSLDSPYNPNLNRYVQGRDEKILHEIQWRPLRINAEEDEDSAERQPDRVVLYDDLKDHLIVLETEMGRRRYHLYYYYHYYNYYYYYSHYN